LNWQTAKMMNTKVDWDQLVDALRDELQEKGGLIRLLNQQTETLYRSDTLENERLEEQIRVQLRTISRCTQGRELALRQTASRFQLNEDVQSNEVIQSFPEYVHPLLEALFSEVDRLSNRMQERLRQNQGLKERFLFETPSTV
jgi:cell division septum initiation protein DivIVA